MIPAHFQGLQKSETAVLVCLPVRQVKVEVLQLSRKEILSFSLSEDARDCLTDYFLNEKSKKLEESEKKAYEKTLGILNKKWTWPDRLRRILG